MGQAQSRVTAQGQISVPAIVRRRLGIGPGSVLEWHDAGNAEVIVRRSGRTTLMDLHNALFKSKPRRRSLTDLKKGIAQHIKRRHARD